MPEPTRRQVLGQIVGGTAAVIGLGTAGWLAAGTGPAVACVRPPGALPEEDFLATCIRCGRCADACPNRCIVAFTEESGREVSLYPGAGQRGTPVIFPRRQACMLCNGVPGDTLRCSAACPTGALSPVAKTAQAIAGIEMGTAEVDEHLCYSFNGASCGVCVRACPLEGTALRAGLWERPVVDEERCIGCGLCERSCVHYPQAIRVRPREARA